MDEITAKAMEIDKAQTEAGDGDRDGDREGEIQNPSSASSSSSSDSDSDSDSDEAAAEDIKSNPQNRSSKTIHGITTLTFSSEAFTDIEKIYECGVHEYLSVPLWCDYLNFVQERDQLVSQCAPAGVLKMRNLFERALTAAGLHIAEGSKIWEAYREYEQAILLTIGGDNNKEKSKQVHRIHALFHRQLSVPLVDLKSTLENYKVWEVEKGDTSDANLEVDGIPSNIVSAYKKALEMYNARRMHEDHLSRSDASDADRLQSFMSCKF